MATLSDLVYIDTTGYHYSDYPTFLLWIQTQYRTIYGNDIYIEPDSQDGQFLAILALAFYQVAALGASVYASFSPASAQGVGLSRNVKINGIERQASSFSTVDLTVVGSAGTTILNGVAQDVLIQKWDLPPTVTIPGGGSMTVTATAEIPGAINALPNTVTQIFTPTLGWQSVNNASAASLGQPVETDAELRIRQQVSVSNPSTTVLIGTQGSVSNVAGVSLVRAYENDTNTTDGHGLPPHSFSLIVAGGDAVVIAQAIALHKTPGTSTYGTTSELVYDAKGMPLTINFFRPTIATISARITIHIDAVLWTSDYQALIQGSVATYLNSLGIGNTVFISRIYSPAYLNGTVPGQSYTITLLELKKNSGSYVTTDISIAFNEQVFCDPAVNVTIVFV